MLKGYTGNLGEEYFGITYYDTAMKVNDAENFKISLTGFANGMRNRVPKEAYEITMKDTSIGNTIGILIYYLPRGNAPYPYIIVCYATLANDHFYSFLATFPITAKNRRWANRFFNSIHFDAEKIKESKYDLSSVLIN